MMAIEMLLDIAPAAGAVGIAAGVGFFLVCVAVAYIAFRLLRKTMKMAFRLAVVAVILFVAAAGSMSIFWFSKSKSPRPRPTATHPR
jgi:hypothetical protein